MEPPAAPVLDLSICSTLNLVEDCEMGSSPITGPRSDDAAVVQIVAHDQINLVPRVRRFLKAYLDADASRRADFRKATAYASRRFEYDTSTNPTLQEDIAAALAIAQEAADTAYGTDIDDSFDGTGEYSADSDLVLLADAFAALAFVYRYAVGFYAKDPTLDDLGEVAVRFVLLAECEHDSALEVTTVTFPERPLVTSDASKENQEFESSLSLFVPTTAGQNQVDVSSLEVISRQVKEPILLTA